MSSDCTGQIRDKESWLTSRIPKDGDAERELSSLLATAAFVRGAVQAIPVPDTAEAESRDKCARIHEEMRRQRHTDEQRRPWPAFMGGWLRVVYALGRLWRK